MSENIIPFKVIDPKPVDVPHLAGECFCGACGHEWVGVVPVGETHVDCPECKRMWGALKSAVSPEVSWRCDCGEQLFWLTPAGAMCRKCGTVPKDWI